MYDINQVGGQANSKHKSPGSSVVENPSSVQVLPGSSGFDFRRRSKVFLRASEFFIYAMKKIVFEAADLFQSK